MNDREKLISEARAALKHAKAPYSNYSVGAALVANSGKIYSGCNIESGAFGTSICAERVAIFSAIAAGESEFSSLAVVTRDGGSPCGSCRQVIHEQCGDIPIYIGSTEGEQIEVVSTSDLLPRPFDFDES